ncbi:MAG: cupin domain-containing protein [Sphingomonadales bacterium]
MPAQLHAIATSDLPWVRLRKGLAMRPLHFEPNGYALQLKLDPGTVIPKHRHTGVVHAINLSGYREIVGDGEIIGPGDFIFEPAGNVDSWRCHGDEPCIIQISLTGRVEYLNEKGEVESYSDSATVLAAYREHCASEGVAPDPRIVGIVR